MSCREYIIVTDIIIVKAWALLSTSESLCYSYKTMKKNPIFYSLQPIYISYCTDRDTGLVWYYLIFIPYKLAVWVSWVSRSEHNTKSYLYQLAVAGRWNTFDCPHEWGARCCRQEVAQWTKICRGLQTDLWRLQGLPLQCLPGSRFPWPRCQLPGLHGNRSCQLSSQERQEGLKSIWRSRRVSQWSDSVSRKSLEYGRTAIRHKEILLKSILINFFVFYWHNETLTSTSTNR